MTRPLIQFDQLNIGFMQSDKTCKPIVRDFSLAIGCGETLGLIGASGSGKTLTALSMLQLLPASAQTSGHIWFAGQDMLSLQASAI